MSISLAIRTLIRYDTSELRIHPDPFILLSFSQNGKGAAAKSCGAFSVFVLFRRFVEKLVEIVVKLWNYSKSTVPCRVAQVPAG